MRYDRKKNPAAAATKEATRYGIQDVAAVPHLDGHYLVSTNGRAAIYVKATADEGDCVTQTTVYPRVAFAAAAKVARSAKRPDAAVTLDGKGATVIAAGATQSFAAFDARFPDAMAVVPTAARRSTLRLNAALLAKLAKGLGVDCVELTFYGGEDDHLPIRVDPLEMGSGDATPDGSFGVIMPIAGPKKR